MTCAAISVVSAACVIVVLLVVAGMAKLAASKMRAIQKHGFMCRHCGKRSYLNKENRAVFEEGQVE